MSLTGEHTLQLRPIGYEPSEGVSPTPARSDHVHNIIVEDWKSLPLENSWVNYDTNDWTPARFLLDPSGFVHLEVAIKNGTITDDTILGTLPEGYRPKYTIPWVGFDEADNIVIGAILPDGSVIGRNNLSATFTAFSVIFEADRDIYVQNRS